MSSSSSVFHSPYVLLSTIRLLTLVAGFFSFAIPALVFLFFFFEEADALQSMRPRDERTWLFCSMFFARCTSYADNFCCFEGGVTFRGINFCVPSMEIGFGRGSDSSVHGQFALMSGMHTEATPEQVVFPFADMSPWLLVHFFSVLPVSIDDAMTCTW